MKRKPCSDAPTASPAASFTAPRSAGHWDFRRSMSQCCPPGSKAVCALHGVFAVRVKGLDGDTVFGGAASLGYKPTVASDRRWLLETFVFNYSGNAYGRIVEIEFVQKLRDEKKLLGLDELKDAIHRDAETARRLLGV